MNNTFCILPWVHMYVGAPGDVKLCCLHNYDEPDLGNLKNNTLEEIWNGVPYTKIRQDFLDGVVRAECVTCHKIEQAGQTSLRQTCNNIWDVNTISPAANAPFEIKYLDIRFSNLCNLKCRTCSESFSSVIMAENLGKGSNSAKTVIFPGKSKDDVLDQIYPHLEKLERIYFAGGEPLVQSQHYDILERLIKIGNTDLHIDYNTNLTNLNYRKGSVLELWQQFKNISVKASVDAIGDAAGYWRNGSSWETVVKNMRQLQTVCPHINFHITCSVSWPNVLNILKLHRFCFEDGLLKNRHKFRMHPVFNPHSLSDLPNWKKEKIVDEIDKYEMENNISEFGSIKNYLRQQDGFDIAPLRRSINEIKRLDALREEHFLDFFPEHTDLLEWIDKQ